jgi:hypothetical protein
LPQSVFWPGACGAKVARDSSCPSNHGLHAARFFRASKAAPRATTPDKGQPNRRAGSQPLTRRLRQHPLPLGPLGQGLAPKPAGTTP